jgi:hypothetical protein
VILDKMLGKMGREKEKFIAAVAQKVRDHGAQFEDVLRDREAKNEKFAFLRNTDVSYAARLTMTARFDTKCLMITVA